MNWIKKYQRVLLIFLMMSGPFMSSAFQYEKWDSQLTPTEVIENYISKGDTSGMDYTLLFLNDHFTQYRNSDLFHNLQKAAARSEKHSSTYLAGLYSLIRRFYDDTGNKTKSLEYALKVYHVLSKSGNTRSLLWIMVDIGNIFFFEKDYDQANIFYEKAEKIAKKYNEVYALSVIYLNFGMVADKKRDYYHALTQYKVSCKYRNLSQNPKLLSSTLIKISDTYINLGQADSALHYIHLTEDYYYRKGTPTDLLNEIPIFIGLAYSEYYALTGDYEKASAYLLNARNASREKFLFLYINTFFTEAEYLIKQKKYLDAISCIGKILPRLQKKGMLENQLECYKILAECYSRTNNLPSSEAAFKNYILINDSLTHSAINSQLNNMRTLTAVFESDSKMQHMQKNIEIAQVNNELQFKQRNVAYWIFIGAAFSIIILLFLFFNLRKNKKRLQQLHFQSLIQNNEIKTKSIELQRSDRIKDKLFSIIAHDLRNPLNRLLVELAIVKKTIGNTGITEPMENTLKETIDLFERLLQWSKMDNKQNIYSPTRINLNENINKIITFYLPEMQLREITVTNNSETRMAFVDPNILQTLFRNFLGNAISAVPKGGIIEIETSIFDGENIEVVFSDSGPGFPEQVIQNFYQEKNQLNAESNGLGLTLCKVLAKMSGWTANISNGGKHGGARVSVIIPLYKNRLDEISSGQVTCNLNIPDAWHERLEQMHTFKFYQTSQIKSFVKSLGKISDPEVSLWIRQIEQAVHEGDKNAYLSLVQLIKYDKQTLEPIDQNIYG